MTKLGAAVGVLVSGLWLAGCGGQEAAPAPEATAHVQRAASAPPLGCGDGVVQPELGEQCDPPNKPAYGAPRSCADSGNYGAGPLGCSATCQYDTSYCKPRGALATRMNEGTVQRGKILTAPGTPDLLAGATGLLNTFTFVRFQLAAAIPANAVITEAQLSALGTDEPAWDVTQSLAITIEDTSNAAPWIATKGNRPVLPGAVTWTPGRVVNGQLVTVDVGPLITALAGKYGGLAAGTFVQLYIRGNTTVPFHFQRSTFRLTVTTPEYLAWLAGVGQCFGHDALDDTTPTINRWAPHPKRPVPDVFCWIGKNIGNASQAMNWNFTEYWYDWSPEHRALVEFGFAQAWNWYENGAHTVVWSGGKPRTPANVYAKWQGQSPKVYTGFSEKDAWQIYANHIAVVLAAGLGRWTPWDILGAERTQMGTWANSYAYFAPATPLLLNDNTPVTPPAGSMQVKDRQTGTLHNGEITPTMDPLYLVQFMAVNNLIASTRRDTIVRLLNWTRDNVSHAVGAVDWTYYQQTWQYPGIPPILRMLSGTQSTYPALAGTLLTHWSNGCHTTTGFLQQLLRVVGIGAMSSYACQHELPSFFTGNGAEDIVALSHGDDPYDQFLFDQPNNVFTPYEPTTPPTSIEQVLMDGATWKSTFGFTVPFADGGYLGAHEWDLDPATCQAVSKPPVAFMLLPSTTPTNILLRQHCTDLQAGLGHAASSVFGDFSGRGYTVADVEASGLWTRIENKRASIPGGCQYYGFPNP